MLLHAVVHILELTLAILMRIFAARIGVIWLTGRCRGEEWGGERPKSWKF